MFFALIFSALVLTGPLPQLGAQEVQTPTELSIQGGGDSGTVVPLVDWGRVGLGLSELFVTVLLGFLVVFFAHRALVWSVGFQTKDLKNDTVSAGVLSASTIIGMSLIIRSLLYPIFNLLHTQLSSSEGLGNVWITLIFLLAFVIIGFSVALGTLFLSLRLFDLLTGQIKEIKEIQNGNLTIALILGAVIVGMSLFLSDGLNSLLVALLPGLQVRLL